MLVRFALQVVAGSVALAPVAAFAPALNDAALNWGGTPKLMDAHPTVRMVDEKITIVVGADMTTADCRFTFRNDGPACTVRMGFPDRADGAADPDEELTEEEMKAPPKRGGMERFQSWVNGREVKTTVERGKESGVFWHTKVVTFPARSTTRIVDRYTSRNSSAIVMFKKRDGVGQFVGYIVHTGASWKGKIGRTEVNVQLPHTIRRVMTFAQAKLDPDAAEYKLDRLPLGTVVYRGMSRPTVSGRKLRFVRTNWRPDEDDDIEIWFDHALSK